MHSTRNRSTFDTDEDQPRNGSQIRGWSVSTWSIAAVVAMFAFVATFSVLLTYNFGVCSDINVQSEVCDKKNVIPITIAINNSRIEPPQEEFDEDLHSGNRTNIHLPKTMYPISYELKLIPFLFDGNFTFEGDVRIEINVTTNCKNITLHAIALKTKQVNVWKIDNVTKAKTKIDINGTKPMTADQFFVIILQAELEANSTYEIDIKYNGTLNENLQGFYRSSYRANNNVTRWLAATQFQPTDARRAFPCFDEPAYKAKFKLWIARLNNMTSLSNMPRIATKEAVNIPGYSWDEFEQSFPMSTYLVAFVVCDFKNLTDGKFSVWARPEAIESAQYALEIGPKLLEFYESYFNFSYPLPKVDMIALPDFSAGAMENWGLVTFREVTMLHDKNISAPLNKQRVATIVAHELAHQWFGDLVTPHWWSDLWLNEGFASYMEYVGANMVNPSWKAMDQFVCNELQNVFNLDSLASSHKISVEVYDPDSINEIFDRISYGKGAAIIRMMEHFLTTKVFRNGLHSYLMEKAYDVATQDDLWSHLTQQAQNSQTFDNLTNVKEIMDTWTTQVGFPVVTVTRNYSTNSIEFSQSRFTFVPQSEWKALKMTFKNALWWIPISYTTSTELDFIDTKPDEWIRGTDTFTKTYENLTETDWILVNIQSTAYYRVNYDEKNWNLLDGYLRNSTTYYKIAPTNRAQMIDDSLALARAGKLSYATALNLTRYLKHETEYVPWRSALGAISFIDNMMISGPHYNLFKEYFLSLIDNVYERIGFDEKSTDEALTAYMRIEVLTFACRLGHSNCIEKSVKLFKQWMNSTDPDKTNNIAPNLRSIVYCTAIKHGYDSEWNFAWNRYLNASVSSEKELLLDAMACSRERWILTSYLERTINENSGVRKQDLIQVFVSVSNNAMGMPITFNFLRTNWDRLKEYLGPPMMNLYILLMYSFRSANSPNDLEMFELFIGENLEGKSRTISQTTENIKVNINWMKENYQTIVYWLGNVTIS